MKVEDKIEECEFNLNQIKHFEPDPYYVNYFFGLFLKSVNQVYNAIFEEANNDFGLFISGECNERKFFEKAEIKKDKKALQFSKWFDEKMNQEHSTPLPHFIRGVIDFQKKYNSLPKIKIMMRAKERYIEDPNQEIVVSLSNGKLRSKEELEIEVKRNLQTFLEIINHKRISKNEPKVNENQIMISGFVQIDKDKEYEIAYACEIYIPVLRRLLVESRDRIKQLTEWK